MSARVRLDLLYPSRSMMSTPTTYPDYNLSPQPPQHDGMNRNAGEIAQVIRLGLNIGDTLEAFGPDAADIWQQNPRTTREFIRCIKDQGFDAVRLPASWDHYADKNTALIDPKWLDRIAEVIGFCMGCDLYVVLNIHWDGGWIEDHVNAASAPTVIPRLRAIWEQIATRVRDFDHRLLLAGMNEPKVDSVEQMAVLMRYHQTFVDAVRSTGGRNAHRCLVLSGATTDIAKSVQWLDQMPADSAQDRLMLEVHYYTPWNFTGMTADEDWAPCFHYWGQANHSSVDPARNPTWGEEDALAELFTRMAAKASVLGVPVLLGEYSARNRVYGASGEAMPRDVERHLASLEHYVETVTRHARLHGMLPFYWDTGALLDRRFCTVRETRMLAALLRGRDGAGSGTSIVS